jgi:hypothetical protein
MSAARKFDSGGILEDDAATPMVQNVEIKHLTNADNNNS